MITKEVEREEDVPDNYRRLGQYIAAAPEDGEKLRDFWIENCDAGTDLEDLDLALAEIDATRALNTRSENRTFHLVVSFRPGEEDRLSKDDLKAMAGEFAKALGYEDHQYIAGTHFNMDSFNLHVAFNKIHPQTLRCETPFKSWERLAATARRLEREYGLHVDVDPRKEKNPLPPHARDHEARTWQQSFEGHLLEHKEAILEALGAANTWQEAHAALAEFDATLKPKGAGFVFAQRDGRRTMKASLLDRTCSRGPLEKRLGPWEPPREELAPKPPADPTELVHEAEDHDPSLAFVDDALSLEDALAAQDEQPEPLPDPKNLSREAEEHDPSLAVVEDALSLEDAIAARIDGP